jgi:hypothetical protein
VFGEDAVGGLEEDVPIALQSLGMEEKPRIPLALVESEKQVDVTPARVGVNARITASSAAISLDCDVECQPAPAADHGQPLYIVLQPLWLARQERSRRRRGNPSPQSSHRIGELQMDLWRIRLMIRHPMRGAEAVGPGTSSAGGVVGETKTLGVGNRTSSIALYDIKKVEMWTRLSPHLEVYLFLFTLLTRESTEIPSRMRIPSLP